ncbi:MAG: glutathione synthase [Hyphomonadaceae bacterium]|nr:glutathione synthase [Hyphomonadaceae bacterium]MBP9234914.1 glutathione synthase [Hyphomonadaceae bacterium]
MSLRIAVQMDPLESVNPAGDTTFMMIEEAQLRGHAVSVYGVGDLAYDSGVVSARVRPAKVFPGQTPHATFEVSKLIDLRRDADVVLMRQDPPFHMGYITAAHLLELVTPDTLVVNDPAGVRSSPEKVLTLMFPDLQPPTLITRDVARVREFRERHGDVVLKPLHGHGGAGVLKVSHDDGNLEAIVDLFNKMVPEPFIAQAFLPAVTEGDKRILIVDGEPVGAINRKPPIGAIRSNLVVGGTAEATELSPREREICTRIGPELKRRGLIFVGIDVIGGMMTEINVTSPTGARALKRLGGVDAVAKMWDVIERRVR